MNTCGPKSQFKKASPGPLHLHIPATPPVRGKGIYSPEFSVYFYLLFKKKKFFNLKKFKKENSFIIVNASLNTENLLTQSVVHGSAESCWKCRISGPISDLQNQNLHLTRPPGNLHAH